MSPSVIAVAGASAPGGMSPRSPAAVGSAQLVLAPASEATDASVWGVVFGICAPASSVEEGCINVPPAEPFTSGGPSMDPAEHAVRQDATTASKNGRKWLIQPVGRALGVDAT